MSDYDIDNTDTHYLWLTLGLRFIVSARSTLELLC